MAQRNKIYQALDTHTILVSRKNVIVGLTLHMGFVNNEKNIEHQQLI